MADHHPAVLALCLAALLTLACAAVAQYYLDTHRPQRTFHEQVLPLCDMAHFDITKSCRFH